MVDGAIISICSHFLLMHCLVLYCFILGLFFYFSLNDDTRFAESFYYHSKMPFESLEIVSSTSSCSSSSSEQLPIHFFQGAANKCDCWLTTKSGSCNSKDKGCRTIAGVPQEDLFIWGDIKFCGKRYSSSQLSLATSTECEKICGSFCTTDSSLNCPIESVSLVKTAEISSDSSETKEYLTFNGTHSMEISRVSSEDTLSFLNNIKVSYNGDPCFMYDRQVMTTVKKYDFMNQKFGCSFDELDTYPYATDLKSTTDGDSFYTSNGLYRSLEAYESGVMESYYSHQTLQLNALGRIEYKPTMSCWDFDVEDLSKMEEAFSHSWLHILWPLAFELFLILATAITYLIAIRDKETLSLLIYGIYLLVMGLLIIILMIVLGAIFLNDRETLKMVETIVNPLVNNNCFTDSAIITSMQNLQSSFETAMAKGSWYIAGAVWAIVAVAVGVVSWVFLMCRIKNN